MRTFDRLVRVASIWTIMLAGGCGPTAVPLKLPRQVAIKDSAFGQALGAVENFELTGAATLNPLQRTISAGGQALNLTIEQGTRVEIKRCKVSVSGANRSGDQIRAAFEVQELDISCQPPLRVQTKGVAAGIDTLTLSPGGADTLAGVRLDLARTLGAALAYAAFGPSSATDSGDASALLRELQEASLDVTLRQGALLQSSAGGASVAVKFPRGARGSLRYPSAVDADSTAATTAVDGTLSVDNKTELEVTIEKTTLLIHCEEMRLRLPRVPNRPIGGQMRVSVAGRPIADELASLIQRQLQGQEQALGKAQVSSVSVDDAGDAILSLALDGRRLTGQMGVLRFKLQGSSDRGHGLNMTASLLPSELKFELGGSNRVEGNVSLPLQLQNHERFCPDTAVGSKRVTFVKVTIVKPIVIEPFDVRLTLDFSVVLQRDQAAITLSGWRDPSGGMTIGAIGDGPNAWGTIDPFTANPIGMRVNYIGYDFSVKNPIPGALDLIVGKTLQAQY